MITTTEQEQLAHEEFQKRMVTIARRIQESKQQLLQEIRDDIHKPEVQAAITELKSARKKMPEK